MDFFSLLSDLGGIAQGVGAVVDVVVKVKQNFFDDPQQMRNIPAEPDWMISQMTSCQAGAADPYHGGTQWLPHLTNMAAQQGSGHIPHETFGIGGVDLTGVWTPPGNPFDQTYVRQSGPYLNVIAGLSGMPTLLAEGVLNPVNGAIFLAALARDQARRA